MLYNRAGIYTMKIKRLFTDKIEVSKDLNKDVKDEPIKLSFIASTAGADRYGDIIEQSGWQLDSYRKNPVILFNHNPQEMSIGKGAVEVVDNALMIDIEFDMDDERAAKIARKAQKGYLNAVSVGFNPIESTPRADLPDGHFAKGVSGNYFSKAELLEVSIVTIPANSEAVAAKDYHALINKQESLTLSAEQIEKLQGFVPQLLAASSMHAKQAEYLQGLFDAKESKYYTDDEDSEEDTEEDKQVKQDENTNFPAMGDNETVSLRNSKYELFPADYAANIKENYPAIWSKGGNILGNQQYTLLSRILKNNGTPETENQEEAVRLREAWAARHEKDYLLAGVVAQMKWYVVGSRGLDHMKQVIETEIAKINKTFGDLPKTKEVNGDFEALFAALKDTFKE